MKNLIVAIILLFPQLSFAQKGQAEKAIQEKYMKEHGNDGMAKMQEFMANMSNAETRPVYKFPISMTMRVTEYKNGTKKDATDMKYHVNGAEETFAFMGKENKSAGKEMMVVYDSKNNTMVMLDEQKKTYVAMNINAFMSAEMQANRGNAKASDNIKCSKSGKTKVIQGYSCEEYICVDKEKDSRSELWVTNKIPVDIAKSFKSSPVAAYFNKVDGMDGLSGMMMEGKFYEKGELKAGMEMLNINEKSNHAVTLSNYKKTDMFSGR